MTRGLPTVRPIVRGDCVTCPTCQAWRDADPNIQTDMSIVADGVAWALSKHSAGQSVEMRLTHAEMILLEDMIRIATRTDP